MATLWVGDSYDSQTCKVLMLGPVVAGSDAQQVALGLLCREGESVDDVAPRVAVASGVRNDEVVDVLRRTAPHKVVVWGQALFNDVCAALEAYVPSVQSDAPVRRLKVFGARPVAVDYLKHGQRIERVVESRIFEAPDVSLVHLMAIPNPASSRLRPDVWRRRVQVFIEVTPVELLHVSVAARMSRLVAAYGGDYADFYFRDYSLSQLLAKAYNDSLITFVVGSDGRDVGLVMKSHSKVAAACFADMLRRHLNPRGTRGRDVLAFRTLPSAAFECRLVDGNLVVSSSSSALIDSLKKALEALAMSNASEQLPWGLFESLFLQRNMRQTAQEVSRVKTYYRDISRFFESC